MMARSTLFKRYAGTGLLICLLVLIGCDVAGCSAEPPALQACHQSCLRLSECWPQSNVASCYQACDDAAPQCGDDPRIADMLNACNVGSCASVSGCLLVGALVCNPLLRSFCQASPSGNCRYP